MGSRSGCGDPWLIGWASTIPWGTAAIAMIVYGHHSDRTGERRWHAALGIGIAGVTLALGGGLPGITAWTGVALVTCTTGRAHVHPIGLLVAANPVLAGTAAAAGIAWINSVGNLAGYLSPFLVGRVRDVSGTMPGHTSPWAPPAWWPR